MNYVMADLHGEYDKFKKMLRLIEFRGEDNLFLLGDLVDRGPEPIKLLMDVMMRNNVFCLLGNHEYMMSYVLERLDLDMLSEQPEDYLEPTDLIAYEGWMQNGGDVTLSQFRKLTEDDREMVLDFIQDMELYEMLEVDGKKFILVHAGLSNFNKERSLDDYEPYELIHERPDYHKNYFDSIYTVTGHTPTQTITGEPNIYHNGTHINIDCGACFPEGRLACLCLDTMEEFYV